MRERCERPGWTGRESMAISKRDLVLEHLFHGLALDGYSAESDANGDYNCFAWAASISHRRWGPYKKLPPGWDWPDKVPREMTIPAFVQAYKTLGYKTCGLDFSLESRCEKIVIYANALDEPQHAARQLADGNWTSKMGFDGRDIHHNSPAGVVDVPTMRHSRYGKVVVCMKRRRKREHICLRMPGVPDNIPASAYGGCLLGWAFRLNRVPGWLKASGPVSQLAPFCFQAALSGFL